MPAPLSEQFIKEKLLTPRQVAEGLGWNIRTFYRKLKAGEFPFKGVRQSKRKLRFRPKDIEAYITQNLTEGGEPTPKKVEPSNLPAIDNWVEVQVRERVRVIATDEEAQEFFKSATRRKDSILRASFLDTGTNSE